jgi:hypothetical protein
MCDIKDYSGGGELLAPGCQDGICLTCDRCGIAQKDCRFWRLKTQCKCGVEKREKILCSDCVENDPGEVSEMYLKVVEMEKLVANGTLSKDFPIRGFVYGRGEGNADE